jgi:hypothetical protein
MKKIKLQDLILDGTIQVRDIDRTLVSRYRQALEAGADFPPIVVEAKTNRVVCGNHRVSAYRQALDPDTEIECLVESYKTEADIIKRAAGDNAVHGEPLTPFDRKRVVSRLLNLKVPLEEIGRVLGLTVTRVEKLAGQTVLVTGNGKAKGYRPVKHGLEHMAGKTLTEEQYETHAKSDMGINTLSLVRQLLRWINSDFIDWNDQPTVDALSELYQTLKLREEVAA